MAGIFPAYKTCAKCGDRYVKRHTCSKSLTPAEELTFHNNLAIGELQRRVLRLEELLWDQLRTKETLMKKQIEVTVTSKKTGADMKFRMDVPPANQDESHSDTIEDAVYCKVKDATGSTNVYADLAYTYCFVEA
jgi:hypothetical protein